MMLDDLSREVKRHKKLQTVPQRNLEMAIIDPNDSSVVSAMVRPEPKKIKIEDFSWIDSKIEDYKRKLSSK
jgi:hypothetical protein